MKNTTPRTLFVWSDESPIAYRATGCRDHLFRRLGSNTVVDLGGDPAAWKVATSDHIVNLASNDQDGFRLSKGITSVARILSGAHTWKTVKTLAQFIEDTDHPLNKDGSSLEEIQAAYAAYRTEQADV